MSSECAYCGESNAPDANWCEACGGDLDATDAGAKAPCVSCGAAPIEVTDDGWCQLCGTKQPAPGDHVERDHGWFAVVSDRGRVHRTNEDAGAVAAREAGAALIVCDGVSSTEQAHHAAQAAAAAMIEILAYAAPGDIATSMIEASQRAQRDIGELAPTGTGEPPSCTLVAVVAERDLNQNTAVLKVGWLGDSRAYWIADGVASQLTRDHSWALEQAELGLLDAETIETDARAHSITRWLGADSPDVAPQQRTVTVDLPGTLLVCSDGLWNYAPTETQMHDLVQAGTPGESALERAQRLVDFANTCGGRDNITVAIAELTDSDNQTTTSTSEE